MEPKVDGDPRAHGAEENQRPRASGLKRAGNHIGCASRAGSASVIGVRPGRDLGRFAWLTASAAEWRSEPVLEDLLQRLAGVDEPLRYLEAFEKLMELPIESLEAITEAITAHTEENEGALELD